MYHQEHSLLVPFTHHQQLSSTLSIELFFFFYILELRPELSHLKILAMFGAWSHQPYMFENLTFCMEAIQICPGFLFPPLSTIILMTLIPPIVSLYFIAIPPAIVLPYQIVNNHKYHAAVHYLQLKFLWGLFRYYWNIYSNSLKKQINSCKFIKMLLRMNFTKVKYL